MLQFVHRVQLEDEIQSEATWEHSDIRSVGMVPVEIDDRCFVDHLEWF